MNDLANWCRKYISVTSLLVIAAFAYILFFQENNMGRIYEYQTTIDSLQAVIARQTDTMNYYHDLNARLQARDPQLVEKAVRENFNMARPQEDVYVFK